jgi:hypothetical protein
VPCCSTRSRRSGWARVAANSALVATAIRDSGDEEALALWGDHYGPQYRRLGELAVAAGSRGLVALDLYVEVDNPGAISELRYVQ